MNKPDKFDPRESRFAFAFARAPVGMVLLTPEGRISEVNQAFEQMIGYSKEELLAGDSAKFTHPDDIAPTRNFFAALRAGPHTSGSIEKRYFRKNGELLWVRASAALEQDGEGNVAQVIAIVENITERKRAETRYRFLAESIPQMVWTATPDGLLDYVNERGRSYFGSAGEGELLGAGWLQAVHPEERERTLAIWKRSLENGSAYETEFRLRRSDGAWRCHLVRALPLRGENGAISQWFGTCTDIEDQKQAAATLARQWQTFDTALSHSPDFTYTLNRAGRITYANRALLALWQKPLEEAHGRTFLDLGYPPELAERLQEQIGQVVTTKQPVRDQAPFTGPSGETRHYEYIFVPVLDADGHVEALAGSSRDVTEQRLITQEIEKDRAHWRELLFQTPAAIALLRGAEHRLEWMNPEFLRLLGRKAERLAGTTVRESFAEAEDRIYIELLDDVYRTGEPFKGRESRVRISGDEGKPREAYLNFVFLPTRDAAGKTDGVFVHIIDVTETVLARKAIEESETQFRTLAESIPHLAWMADGKGDIFWYNQRWYDYTGTLPEEVKGWGWTRVHDPSVLPAVLQRWQAALDKAEAFEMVFPLKSAAGVFRSFLTRIQPVKDSEGRVVRWFGTNTDVTEQQETERELRRMNRELEEFSYVASHDLQEPLRVVNIYTQLLTRRFAAGDAEALKHAEQIGQGVRRMEALIKGLLTFSRTVHAEALPVGNADLAEAWQEACSALKERIEECGARIAHCALPKTRGDTEQLSHVFQNVLSNSLKYRKKGIAPEIRVSAERGDGEWLIAVQDNGIGFEPEYAERIFGLFKRLHKSDEYPGTGLGLAICKRIVERFGGRMWAEGRLGEGTAIRFALPAVAEGDS